MGFYDLELVFSDLRRSDWKDGGDEQKSDYSKIQVHFSSLCSYPSKKKFLLFVFMYKTSESFAKTHFNFVNEFLTFSDKFCSTLYIFPNFLIFRQKYGCFLFQKFQDA